MAITHLHIWLRPDTTPQATVGSLCLLFLAYLITQGLWVLAVLASILTDQGPLQYLSPLSPVGLPVLGTQRAQNGEGCGMKPYPFQWS